MRLIDADKLHYNRIRIAHDDGTVGGYNAVVMSAEIKDAPTVDVVVKRSGMADNCPIIQIKPHGRLIDADDFKKSIYKYFDAFRGTEFNDLVKGLLFAAHILGDAPTVIPEDRDGESDA
jgi:hypothetical protein